MYALVATRFQIMRARMTRRWIGAGCFVVALWAQEPYLVGQRTGQVFVGLTAPDGTPVTDLQVGDVGISEDGVECRVLRLEPTNWPAKVQVLVDNGRANTETIIHLRDGLQGMFERIPDGAEISLYTIAGTPRPVIKATTERQKLVSAIGLIGPDHGAGAFFDALLEAADRVLKDNTPHFPVIVMVGSDLGRLNPSDREYQKLQDTVIVHGVTVHVVLTSVGAAVSSSGGLAQAEVGRAIAKVSGGRFDTIATSFRLATLLPELGAAIGSNYELQRHQYRVTYERPSNSKASPRIGVSVSRPGKPRLSLNGRIP
jgi:hypothetical protein